MSTQEITYGDSKSATQLFEEHYKQRHGYVTGFIPQDLEHIGKWLSDQVGAAYQNKEERGAEWAYLPPVNSFINMLEDPVNMVLKAQVEQMIKEALIIHQQYEPNVPYYINDLNDLYVTLNFMIIQAPRFAPKVSHSAFPMSGLFVYMMATTSGWNVFRNTTFNDSLRGILNWWCDYLDSESSKSVVVTTPGGWLSPESVIANNLNEFVTEQQKIDDPIHWGFKSFNGFFHRGILPQYRPLSGPGDPSVVVSPNDGTVYRLARDVQRQANFEIKSQPYSLVNILNNTEYVDSFVGGDVLQTFLSGHDLHRWNAPITGKILYAEVIPAYMFSELPELGFDPTGGTYSQGYEANVNTRALIVIDSGKSPLGIVAVMPIGITEISSITLEVAKGDFVQKGQELGYFSYGGSSMCVLFQKGAIQGYILPKQVGKPAATVRVKKQIAIANL